MSDNVAVLTRKIVHVVPHRDADRPAIDRLDFDTAPINWVILPE